MNIDELVKRISKTDGLSKTLGMHFISTPEPDTLQATMKVDAVSYTHLDVYKRQEHIFAHRLRCILRIDAGRAQEEEFLHAMRISVADYVALHLHVLHDEVCTIQRIRHDTAHEGSSQYYCIRLFLVKELLYCILVGQVEFFVRTTRCV